MTVATKEFVDVPPVPLVPLPTWLHPPKPPRKAERTTKAASLDHRFLPGQAMRNAQATITPAREDLIRSAPVGNSLRIAADCAGGLLILRTTVNGVNPSRLGCAGRNVQVDPVGSPEQLNVRAPEKPNPGSGVSKRFVTPGPDPEMTTFPGLAAISKLGLPTINVAAPEVELTKLESPE